MKTKNRLSVVARATRRNKKKTLARANGVHAEDTQSTIDLPMGVSTALARILRPQAAYRWILPYLSAITPSYIESTLRGALAGNHVQQWELFDLMLDTWPELTSCAQELTNSVLSKKLIFEAYHDEDQEPSNNAQERMKLVSSALRRMDPSAAADENDLRGTIKDILDGWFRGVTALEIDWRVDRTINNGATATFIGPRATFWVHPVCFAFNSDGVLGLRTGSPMVSGAPGIFPFASPPTPNSGVVDFPENKFLVGIHKTKSGTALGGAMLRPLAWWWLAANFSADWLLNLAQLFGLPFRWATYDANAPQATIDAICNMLQQMGSAGYAAFPEGTNLEFMESGAGRQAEYSPQGTLLDRADQYARTILLGQTMTGQTMSTGKGGQAFGEVETDVKALRVEAAGDYACDVINRQLIRAILLLNYGDAEEAPSAKLLEQEEADYSAAQRDDILVNKLGLKIGANFVRKKYDVPEPAAAEELLAGAPKPATPTGGDPNNPDAGATNDQQDKTLARIAAIKDDALFAKSLIAFADQLKSKP